MAPQGVLGQHYVAVFKGVKNIFVIFVLTDRFETVEEAEVEASVDEYTGAGDTETTVPAAYTVRLNIGGGGQF